MRICYLHLFFTSLHLNLSISPQPILNRLYFPPCMILVKDTSDSDLYKYSSWSPVCTLLCLSLAHSVVVYLSWKHFLSWSSKGLLFLCDPMDGSMPGFSVHHQLPELAQIHVHRVGDAIQPSHPLSSSSPTFNLSQHQGLFQWVSSLHQVAKVLDLQLQDQSFQWILRTDFL